MRPQLSTPTSRYDYFLNLFKLARAKMTVVSAVTHLAASIVTTTSATGSTFSVINFFSAWIFILFTQFMTHFLGEVYDRPSDILNKYSTPLTGGSKVLVSGLISTRVALRMACYAALVSICSLLFLVPSSARSLGFIILPLAVAYSAPPFKLNHNALGELEASFITSVLVPLFSTASQHSDVSSWSSLFHPALLYLIIPPFFIKISLFLVLNLADKRPDWAGGKITIPVLLGNKLTAVFHLVLMIFGYMSAVLITVTNCFKEQKILSQDVTQLLLILPSAPLGFSISHKLLHQQLYRLDHLLGPSLLHSTLVVWGVLIHSLLGLALAQGVLNFQFALAFIFGWMTFKNLLKGKAPKKQDDDRAETEETDSLALTEAGERGTKTKEENDSTDSFSVSSSKHVQQINTSEISVDSDEHIASLLRPGESLMEKGSIKCDVIIVGAGVAGLVAAASLRRMGRSIIVLEKRPTSNRAESGADLALWPSAITILKRLGIRSSFFEDDCFPIERVHMCNMNYDSLIGAEDAAKSVSILKTIDMKEVTRSTGENFVLVSRQRLMNALREIVPDSCIIYDTKVVDVTESEESESVEIKFTCNNDRNRTRNITSRVAIGADGSRSRLREHIYPEKTASDIIQFCGEVCYRGVIHMSDLEDEELGSENLRTKVEKLFLDRTEDHTMRINYGAGMRSSYGYMSTDGEIAYWWVKQPADTLPEHRGKLQNCTWPEPLKTLHDITSEKSFYMHMIEQGENLSRWSSNRVALVGDSAHVLSPNMGQGACLAIEDSFVLCTELSQFWMWPDGHLEAFYRYETSRKPFVKGVANETKKQLFLGQFKHATLVRMREFLLQAIPTSVLQRTLKRNNFNIETCLNSFHQQIAQTNIPA